MWHRCRATHASSLGLEKVFHGIVQESDGEVEKVDLVFWNIDVNGERIAHAYACTEEHAKDLAVKAFGLVGSELNLLSVTFAGSDTELMFAMFGQTLLTGKA